MLAWSASRSLAASVAAATQPSSTSWNTARNLPFVMRTFLLGSRRGPGRRRHSSLENAGPVPKAAALRARRDPLQSAHRAPDLKGHNPMLRLVPPLLVLHSLLLAAGAAAAPLPKDPDARAAAVLAKMRPDERTILTVGVMALPFADPAPSPPGAGIDAGFVAGFPRPQAPPLSEATPSCGAARWRCGRDQCS